MLTDALLLLMVPALAFARDRDEEQKTINVDVGNGGFVFNPRVVTAAAGSSINFHFFPGDHSVAQSTYSHPCMSLGPGAIYSGFVDTTSGVAGKMFTITLNDTNPIWLYCTQVSHCQAGMAMVINPPSSGETIGGYINAASSASTTAPPTVQGGVFSPNQADSGSQPPESPEGGGGTDTILTQMSTLRKAHGAIMALSVVLLLPIGALWMRLLSMRGLIWFHAGWQIFSLLLFTAGFGIGEHLASELEVLYEDIGKTHTIIGTVVLALMWIQPILGILHHLQFIKKQSRSTVSHAHIWNGRAMFILAIVNGGLGLQLATNLGNAPNTGTVQIAYGVVAGVMGVVYIAAAIYGETRRRKVRQAASYEAKS